MINIVVAYDDNDPELGDYFELCYNDLYENLSILQGLAINSIRGLDCNEDGVLERIQSFEEENFGFVGLSHGNDRQLLTENDVYVDVENLSHFCNSLFYSTACSTGIELGKELIKNNCQCYVGFKEDTYATYEDFYDIYIECENYCLKDFFSSQNTIKESFNNMLNHFDKHILDLESKDEILVAMELIGNKDSFVLYGNEDLKRTNLE